jgi:hypothetical protein
MSRHAQAVTCPRPPCQDFAAIVPATRGLIAAPWTPLASLCSAGVRGPRAAAGMASASAPFVGLASMPVSTLAAGFLFTTQEIVYA